MIGMSYRYNQIYLIFLEKNDEKTAEIKNR